MADGAALDSLVEEGGAVVESGKSEAGGGKETSASGAGRGACSFEDGGVSPEDWGFRLFRLAAAAVTAGGCSLASPNFARS